MVRTKGPAAHPKARFAWRDIIAVDRLAWTILEPQCLGGIDAEGNLAKQIKISPGFEPVLTTDGILCTGNGSIWMMKAGLPKRVRYFSPSEAKYQIYQRVTPMGLLAADKIGGNPDSRTVQRHVSVTPIAPFENRRSAPFNTKPHAWKEQPLKVDLVIPSLS